MPTLTIFANFYINDEERFLRMQDSFKSFKDIGAKKWVINIRGKFKLEALSFLREQLGPKLISYQLESKKGWFYDTQQMLKDIDTDYVFFWVEDHINLVSVSKYVDILKDMEENQSEYLPYSWWHSGQILKSYEAITKKEMAEIYTFVLNKSNSFPLRISKKYIIGMQSIFATNLFKKIVNRGLEFLRRWPKFTPFNFEKDYFSIHWLPIKYAIPKYELFAAIDDDQGDPGYSLQSRGLYPIRKPRFTEAVMPEKKESTFKKYFEKNIWPKLPKGLQICKLKIWGFSWRLKRYLTLILKGQ